MCVCVCVRARNGTALFSEDREMVSAIPETRHEPEILHALSPFRFVRCDALASKGGRRGRDLAVRFVGEGRPPSKLLDSFFFTTEIVRRKRQRKLDGTD